MNPHPGRVLCAEGYDDTCFMLTTLLGSKGHEASAVRTVAGALRRARGKGFDLYSFDN